MWRKSSYSNPHGCCVEVDLGPRVLVRDSKDPDGPRLAIGREDWAAFLARIREEGL
jgi:hypothetical protein